MRIELGTLSLEELALELPAAATRPLARRLRIQYAEGLCGTLETDDQGFRISGLASQRLRLSSLAWSFGKVLLASEQAVELGGLSGSIRRGGREVALKAATLQAPHVTLRVGDLLLAGKLQARDVALEIGEDVGLLRFGSAVLEGFEVDLTSLHASTPALHVSELVTDWGGAAFRMEVRTAEAPQLDLQRGEQRAHATGVELVALESEGRRLSLGQTRVATLEVEAPFPRAEPKTAEQPAPAEAPARRDRLFDLTLLNGLSGRLRADVDVDMAVPFLGRRRATHRPRLSIAHGALDYMELESGLATLEDALIDFSVREGALVLERGLPILPTRGRGKPILIWDLEPDDMALAQQRRLRLALLPSFRLASKSADDSTDTGAESGGSAFRLRELSLLDLDASLTAPQNPPAPGGAVHELTFGELTLQGEVHYTSERAPRPGRLELGVDGLRTLLRALPIGASELEMRLEIGAMRNLAIAFEGLRPRSLKGQAEGIAIAQLRIV